MEPLILVFATVCLLSAIAHWTGAQRRIKERRLLSGLCIISIFVPIIWPFAMAFALFGDAAHD